MSDFIDRKILACVTGASGFIGAAVALRFLDLGHSVRLPLRTQAQLDAWRTKHGKQYGDRLEVVLLGGGIEEDGVFDEIVKGCEAVVHAASPAKITIDVDAETDLLKPPLRGTLSILESARKASSVRSFVYTSSVAAHVSPEDLARSEKEDVVVDETTWNPTTYEDAARMPVEKAYSIYSAGKALAEKAAWDFVKQNNAGFAFSTVAPVWVIGANQAPTIDTFADFRGRSSVGVSLEMLWNLSSFSQMPFRFPDILVSINTVAAAHVAAALSTSISNGHRYLLCSDLASPEQLVRCMIEHEPALEAHLPKLEGGKEDDPGAATKARMEAGRVKELGVDSPLTATYSSRSPSLLFLANEPFDKYVGAYAKQLVELAKAAGEL